MTEDVELERSELRRETGKEPSVETNFRFDCEYCSESLETTTLGAMKNQGTRHLKGHKDALLELFADKDRGKHCQNDCGYVFPVGREEVAGFRCPECGYDNFEEFTHRYLYWQLTHR